MYLLSSGSACGPIPRRPGTEPTSCLSIWVKQEGLTGASVLVFFPV